MEEITTITGQNVFDLALSLYGDVSRAVDIVNDNGLDYNQEIPAGLTIKYKANDNAVKRYYSQNNIIPSSVDPIGRQGKAFDDSYDLSFK